MLERKGKYRITRENLASHELNGLKTLVLKSADAGRKRQGKIVKETKNTFVLETGKGKEKIFPKKECEFEFSLGKEKARLNGKSLLFRPEDRVKENYGKIAGGNLNG